MNIAIWVLQAIAALLYGSSGVMKVFMFDQISRDVPSFGALPRRVWLGLGMLEMACTVALIVPGLVHWHSQITSIAALILAVECLLFITVHFKYREVTPMIFSGVLCVLMTLIAYSRSIAYPLS